MTPTIVIDKSVVRCVVRKQSFKVNSESLWIVLEQLLSERHTGVITITTSQGGVLGLVAEDKQKLSDEM